MRKLLNHPNPEEIYLVLKRLEPTQLGILLNYAAEWNTNTRTYLVIEGFFYNFNFLDSTNFIK